jgi:beta-galactosidase
MELGVGSGKVILCALDLEDHWDKDAAAAELAKNILAYAASATLPPRAKNVVYVGGDQSEQILKQLGAVYSKSDNGEADADLTIVGEGGRLTVQPKGRVVLLPNARKDMLTQASNFHGSLDVPEWPEARGLSPSDLRWRADDTADIFKPADGFEIAADGLLARSKDGRTIACQVDPALFDIAAKPYFHFTQWRQTRALSQILANLGVTFDADQRVFAFEKTEDNSQINPGGTGKQKPPTQVKTVFYHPDYRADFDYGDDPYRFFRW